MDRDDCKSSKLSENTVAYKFPIGSWVMDDVGRVGKITEAKKQKGYDSGYYVDSINIAGWHNEKDLKLLNKELIPKGKNLRMIISYDYPIGARVKTCFGAEGIIELVATNEYKNSYFVKTKDYAKWFQSDEIDLIK